MKQLDTIETLRAHQAQNPGVSRGFVPTMGALHKGHLALVKQALQENDEVTVSIFVNPTQFNSADDLDKYPRTLRQDAQMLEEIGTHVLFTPKEEEIYPEDLDTRVPSDRLGLDQRLEGAFRPGHFDGVRQVVHRLLQIVQPDRLYLGQKDYQQLLIVREMVDQLNLPVEVVAHPIVREDSGLAFSSRNQRLTTDQYRKSPWLFRALNELRHLGPSQPLHKAYRTSWKMLHQPGFQPEYLEIVDASTLLPVKDWSQADNIIALTAVWAGEVRLIDNLFLKRDGEWLRATTSKLPAH